MLDSLFLFAGGLACLGLVALVNPILLGWRSRRDAVVALAIAMTMFTAALAARMF